MSRRIDKYTQPERNRSGWAHFGSPCASRRRLAQRDDSHPLSNIITLTRSKHIPPPSPPPQFIYTKTWRRAPCLTASSQAPDQTLSPASSPASSSIDYLQFDQTAGDRRTGGGGKKSRFFLARTEVGSGSRPFLDGLWTMTNRFSKRVREKKSSPGRSEYNRVCPRCVCPRCVCPRCVCPRCVCPRCRGVPTVCVPTVCVPTVCVPTVCVPTVCVPTVCVPTVCVPTVCVPTVCVPTVCVPTVCVPTVCVPTVCVPTVCVPTVCVPTVCVPTVCVPTVCVPTVCVPTVCVPTVCVPTVCVPTVCVPTVCAHGVCAHGVCAHGVCAHGVCAHGWQWPVSYKLFLPPPRERKSKSILEITVRRGSCSVIK